MKRQNQQPHPSGKAPTYKPKTNLGRAVLAGESIDLHQILSDYKLIKQSFIADQLGSLSATLLDSVRTSHTLTSGKFYVYRVVAAVGDKNGIIGLGCGKAVSKADAFRKAVRRANKKLIMLPDLNNLTVPSRKTCKKGSLVVGVTPLPKGSGVKASYKGKTYCTLAGVTDLAIYAGNKGKKSRGQVKSAYNYFTALHEIFDQYYKQQYASSN